MAHFEGLKLCTLTDLLSDFTAHYAELLTRDPDKENADCCKETIQLLQSEINYRNRELTNQPQRASI